MEKALTVLIVTSFGATKNYPDQEMMRRTFAAFLGSLRRQTDQRFHLFISHHDRPDVPAGDPWIHWCPIACGEGLDAALVLKEIPRTAKEAAEKVPAAGNGKNTDMGRKTYNSVYEAGRWAHGAGLSGFWMLRMDSDDLLWNGMVGFLNALDTNKHRAVYNRNCHMFDPRLQDLAVHNFPYSTTCNALWFEMDDEGTFRPEWFYHCNDHTEFMRQVRKDRIPFLEVDDTLCILTNCGNHISNRPEIDLEKNVRKIPYSRSLAERYGLDALR
jgi:hypothetical protein